MFKEHDDEHDHVDSTFTETMVARIEINELGDPARQKEITDAVEGLHGVIELQTEKGALHVSYDPLAETFVYVCLPSPTLLNQS